MENVDNVASSVQASDSDAPYVAPQVEVVLTPDELAREIQYAGIQS